VSVIHEFFYKKYVTFPMNEKNFELNKKPTLNSVMKKEEANSF